MRHTSTPVRALAAAALMLLAACADNTPVAPVIEPAPRPLAALDCVADVRARSVRCTPATPAAGASGNVVLGHQGTYVRLAGSGITYDGDSVFTMQVTVQNLLGQPIGTTDGTTVDPDGIQVFFATGPVATGGGTGTVEVANEDGNGTFLGPMQPFFRYVERLGTEQTSAAHEWRFHVPNTTSQFSFGVYVSAPVPHQTALQMIDTDPRTLAAGGLHTCAITTAGEAYCWGKGGNGELGSVQHDSVPRLVAGGHHWRTVVTGMFHTCGITTENRAYCWGDGDVGQLGSPSEPGATGPDSWVPREVSGGMTWLQIDAGSQHTCGVTTDYAAYCWGIGDSGQLGAGDSASSITPVLVQGGHRWAMVDAGEFHSCGVTRGGAAYCWGYGEYGALGTPSPTSTARPVLVAGDHSWRTISAAAEHTCGVTSLGVAMCWGDDYYQFLGNGAAGSSLTPTPVAGGLEWARVETGRWGCGVTTGAQGYCWGLNQFGAVGDGTTEPREAPVTVAGGHLWARIESGDSYSCGIDQQGVAYCWGFNLYGNLGDNSSQDRHTPVVVAGGHTWAR